MKRTEWGCRSLRPFNKNGDVKYASATRRNEISNVVNNERVSISDKEPSDAAVNTAIQRVGWWCPPGRFGTNKVEDLPSNSSRITSCKSFIHNT